jgi:putative Mn2+ efflux pump MntP
VFSIFVRQALLVARTGRLVVTAAALSMDNLVIGFALGTYKVSLPLAAASSMA